MAKVKPEGIKRRQCQLRLWEDDWKRLEAKVVVDGVTYQKIGELLLLEYLNGNKEIMKIVEKYKNDKEAKKKRRHNSFDNLQLNELTKIIEQESPFEDEIKQAYEELKTEENLP
jgi:hypothetical protein